MDTQQRQSFLMQSPSAIFLIVVLSVFFSEVLVILLLHYLPLQTIFGLAIIDSILLVALVSPALYFFLFRPLTIHIRERERIEEVLRRNEEEKFKAMIRTSLDGFKITDIHRHILEVNDSYCKMTGYSREELLNMSASDIEVDVTNEESERYIARLTETGSDRLEIKFRRKDGQVRIVAMSSNFSDQFGGCIFSFMRDITEDKKVEMELYQHRLRLEELVAARTMQVDKQALIFESANANLSNMLEECRQKLRNRIDGVSVD